MLKNTLNTTFIVYHLIICEQELTSIVHWKFRELSEHLQYYYTVLCKTITESHFESLSTL